MTQLPHNFEWLCSEENTGDVSLNSLTSLPDNVAFNNGGYVDLSGLTVLPDNLAFNNGGHVYLHNLKSPNQIYRGKAIRIEFIDGYTMLMGRSRMVGGVNLTLAQYFGGGDLDKLPKCYVARQGEYTAHGATADEAIRDVRFKFEQVNFDPSELIETIKARGTVSFNDFRLLTGACAEGLRHGMEEVGFDPLAAEIELSVVLSKAHGSFGAKFQSMFMKGNSNA